MKAKPLDARTLRAVAREASYRATNADSVSDPYCIGFATGLRDLMRHCNREALAIERKAKASKKGK